MADVITAKITYEDCEDKIWRVIQISENAPLSQLCYTILATFDTMAYHLFSINCKGVDYGFPDEDGDGETSCNLFFTKIKDLKLKEGDLLEMTYDFSCNQLFCIKIVGIEEMTRGTGRAYPRIIAGEGRGIIDDMSASELIELINEIDKTGSTSFIYSENDEQIPWDYRNYDIKIDNSLLKGSIENIKEGYEK